MTVSYGQNLKLEIFGESHGPHIGMTLEGLPPGLRIDLAELQAFLNRRAPGRSDLSTARKEDDVPLFTSGLTAEGLTDGNPVRAIIENKNAVSKDYDELINLPRPGHADYTARLKYGSGYSAAGGGRFSGRMTAPLCVAGGICKQLLREYGVEIISRIASVGSIEDEGPLTDSTASKDFPTVSDEAGGKMKSLILEKKAEGDSIGGIVECAVTGCPGGLGGPLFEGMEGRISSIIFAIPGVKGIEFGAGFGASRLTGSENNDSFRTENGRIVTETNNCGGILGGITDGMPLTFKAAFKPTPSIAKPQKTVNLETLEETTIEISGRHDPCIVPRAVPCVEAAAAIAVYDALLETL